MAKNETRQLPPAILAEDREIYTAIKALTDYAPANRDFSQEALDASLAAVDAAQALETQTRVAWEAARDDKVAAEWALHNKLLGGKDQVQAQYGPNSNQLQSVKRKKKTEYKSPGRGSKKDGGSNQ
jgi:hypothetical protein